MGFNSGFKGLREGLNELVLRAIYWHQGVGNGKAYTLKSFITVLFIRDCLA